jgi:hypothetical protein
MWDLGDAEDGLVATNRGIDACLRVLGWTLTYLRDKDSKFDVAPMEEIVAAIEPYGEATGRYFGGLSSEEVRTIRRVYGSGAPAAIAYSIGEAIRQTEAGYEPEGLLDWIQKRSSADISDAKDLSSAIERRLITSIVGRLKEEYGEGESGWWARIPLKIRQEAVARREEDPSGPVESFFYLIDLRTILQAEWPIFQETFGIGSGSTSKTTKTEWLVKVNEVRNRADHAGGMRLKEGDVEFLRSIDATLTERGI